MMRGAILCAALLLPGCASRIELPGTVLLPEPEAVAVEGMGPPVDWPAIPAVATSDIASYEALAQAFPNSAALRLRLMRAHLSAGDEAEAIAIARALGAEGYSFDAASRDALANLIRTAGLPRWFHDLEANGNPVTASETVARIPHDIRLPEAVLHDPVHDRLFAATIVSRSLFYSKAGEPFRAVAIRDAGSLGGIALDEARGLLWVSSGTLPQTPRPDTAFRGVIAIDRVTLEERRRVPLPAGVSVGDIAVGPDGTVYTSDPVAGGIWVATPGQAAMQAFIPPGTFRSPQGIAVRPDNGSLYVSDYGYGLAQVIIRSRHVYRMRSAVPMMLDGIDGLWLVGNELVAVQNGTSPKRIVAMQLGQGVGVIASQRVIEQAHPDWTEPLGGAVMDGMLTYIGNGQWDVYGEGGVTAASAFPRATGVRRVQVVESVPE